MLTETSFDFAGSLIFFANFLSCYNYVFTRYFLDQTLGHVSLSKNPYDGFCAGWSPLS